MVGHIWQVLVIGGIWVRVAPRNENTGQEHLPWMNDLLKSLI
jgi:hypothetical protein